MWIEVQDFAYGYSIVLVSLVERTILSLLNHLCTFVKSIAGLCFVLLIYLCILGECHNTFITLASSVLKSNAINHPTLFFFLKVVLVILGPLYFHMNFGISLSVSTVKPVGNLIEITLNL